MPFLFGVVALLTVIGIFWDIAQTFRIVPIAEVEVVYQQCASSGGRPIRFTQKTVTCEINGHELSAPNPFTE